jgi:hypothetical protein
LGNIDGVHFGGRRRPKAINSSKVFLEGGVNLTRGVGETGKLRLGLPNRYTFGRRVSHDWPGGAVEKIEKIKEPGGFRDHR